MAIWTRTKSRYERKQKVDWSTTCNIYVCSQCGYPVMFDAQDNARCKYHPITTRLAIPQGQYLEFVETLKYAGMKIEALKDAIKDVYSGDGHAIDAATKLDSIISREFDPAWEIHCQEVNDTRATDYPM